MRANTAISEVEERSGVAGLLVAILGKVWLVVSRVGILFVMLEIYTATRKRWFLRPAEVAFDHALDVIAVQEALRIDIELRIQRWTLERPWAVDLVNFYYTNLKTALYLSAALAVLLAPVSFRRVRRAVIVATLLAWPWFFLYPLSPPRFMGSFGYAFIDTVNGVAGSTPPPGGANPFAAMPSMHIGWTALVALWLAAALPWYRIGAILGTIHLALMSFAVVATGNHWVLDIVAGLVLAGVAILIARLLPEGPIWTWWSGRDEPHRWSPTAGATPGRGIERTGT